jgi:thiosulfate/3-mercaptopyruvate sulfurtransferase
MTQQNGPQTLVSTTWVEENIEAPNLRLVEVDVDTSAYNEGHIPGAVAWNWTTDTQDQIRRDIPDQAQFEQLLSRSGIRPDTTVVLYGDNNNWFAAYAFWLLELYGHPHIRLMDGGRQKWLAEGRPLSKDRPQIEPADYRVQAINMTQRALWPDVQKQLENRGTFVDVRSPAEFSGEVLAPPGLSETAQRGGHIPGAANIPWSKAVAEDGTFRSLDELRRLYAEQGVTEDKDVVVYCRIGERSSHSWFVLRHLLGFETVRNYDGSWTEWGSMIGNPIERG